MKATIVNVEDGVIHAVGYGADGLTEGQKARVKLTSDISVAFTDSLDGFWSGPRWMLSRRDSPENLLTLHEDQLVDLNCLRVAIEEIRQPGSTVASVTRAMVNA